MTLQAASLPTCDSQRATRRYRPRNCRIQPGNVVGILLPTIFDRKPGRGVLAPPSLLINRRAVGAICRTIWSNDCHREPANFKHPTYCGTGVRVGYHRNLRSWDNPGSSTVADLEIRPHIQRKRNRMSLRLADRGGSGSLNTKPGFVLDPFRAAVARSQTRSSIRSIAGPGLHR